MTENPLVSVIIPVHNRPVQLRTAIQSVFNQKFQDFEIIVVDDCSIKPVQPIIGDLKQVRVIRHAVNKGAASARNTGIRNARGDLISFLDSDDYWLPEKLDLQVGYLNNHPEVGAVTTGFYYIAEEEKSIEIPAKQRDWYRHFCNGMLLSPGTTLMVRKMLMLDCLYDENFPRLEDLDWALRFSKDHLFDVIQKPLAVVNQGRKPSAVTVEKADLCLIEKYRRAFLELGWFYGRQCIGKRYLEIAIYFFREGKRKKGIKYLKSALKENPFLRPGMYLQIIDYLIGTSFVKTILKVRQKVFWKKS